MSEEEMKALVEMNNMLKHENTKLKHDKQKLIEWLEDEIKNCNPNPQLYFNAQDEIKRHLYSEILEKLGE